MPRKKKEYLFVDGYNIINQWKMLREHNDNIDISRNKLIESLSEFKSYKGINVVVVFDAYLVKGSTEKKENYLGVEIVYTKENETADSYIEKQLDKIGRSEKVQVATSDNYVQQIVLARGGTRLSAEELFLEFTQIKKEIQVKTHSVKQNSTKIYDVLDDNTLEKLKKLRSDIE